MHHAIRPIVIGFGGSALSGKSHLSERVAVALGWPRTSFGDYVRDQAQARGLEPNRETLQSIGESLIGGGAKEFCSAVLKRADWTVGRGIILDGIRHASIVGSLRDLVAPTPFVLVLVTASESLRRKRLEQRQMERGAWFEGASVADIDQHSTEREVQTLLPSMADLTVETSDGGDDRTDDVLHWLAVRLAAR